MEISADDHLKSVKKQLKHSISLRTNKNAYNNTKISESCFKNKKCNNRENISNTKVKPKKKGKKLINERIEKVKQISKTFPSIG